jgi:hypothetical protein
VVLSPGSRLIPMSRQAIWLCGGAPCKASSMAGSLSPNYCSMKSMRTIVYTAKGERPVLSAGTLGEV